MNQKKKYYQTSSLLIALSLLPLSGMHIINKDCANEALIDLFSYQKGGGNKEIISKRALTKNIIPYFSQKEEKQSLKDILGCKPTLKDERVFTCLQWAYQKGHSNTITDDQVKEDLSQLFTTWRRKEKKSILDIQNELPPAILTYIQQKEFTRGSFTLNEVIFEKEKDKNLLLSLRWAYHLNEDQELFSEKSQKTPPSNISEKVITNEEFVNEKFVNEESKNITERSLLTNPASLLHIDKSPLTPSPQKKMNKDCVNKALIDLFSYKKGEKSKEIISKRKLTKNIIPYFSQKEEKQSLENILDCKPTPKDKRVFTCLQWAYQKGHSNTITITDDQVKEDLAQLFTAWRRKEKKSILDIQNELPPTILTYIQQKESTRGSFTLNEVIFEKEKDKNLLLSLQWAYHLNEDQELFSEKSQETSLFNIPEEVDINQEFVDKESTNITERSLLTDPASLLHIDKSPLTPSPQKKIAKGFPLSYGVYCFLLIGSIIFILYKFFESPLNLRPTTISQEVSKENPQEVEDSSKKKMQSNDNHTKILTPLPYPLKF